MQNERLSITQRYILTYIRFRTNNNRQFFANNEAIAKAIGCTTISTKVIINKLIRDGYIVKTIDDKGRRNLALSGKEFLPLDGVDMSSLDKRILKQEAQNQERDANYFKQQYEGAKDRIQFLENEISNKNKQILELQIELTELKEKQSIPTPISRTKEPIEPQEIQESLSQPNTSKPNQQEGLTPEEALAQIFGQFALQQGFNNDYNE